MYEFTNKGAWFRWSALDAGEKKLVGGALVLMMPASVIAGLIAGSSVDWLAYRIGHWLGSGGRSAGSDEPYGLFDRHIATFDLYPLIAAASVVMLLAGLLLWIRFSRAQDELFNRVQNYTLGCGSTVAVVALILWAMLASAGLAPPVAGNLLMLIWLIASLAALRHAVSKWA